MQRPWNPTPPSPRQRELCLTFAPLAWLKLVYLCHLGPTEIGGFGLSAPDHLLYVQDFVTVRQKASPVTVRFFDEAVADHFDRCIEDGLSPQRCGRLWIHTHPGDSPLPTSTDEETFARSFGSCDWAVMMILARSGQTFARLALNVGPTAEIEVPVHVDWSALPESMAGSVSTVDHAALWRQEYDAHVERHSPPLMLIDDSAQAGAHGDPWWADSSWPLGQEYFEPRVLEEDLVHDSRPCPHAG